MRQVVGHGDDNHVGEDRRGATTIRLRETLGTLASRRTVDGMKLADPIVQADIVHPDRGHSKGQRRVHSEEIRPRPL